VGAEAEAGPVLRQADAERVLRGAVAEAQHVGMRACVAVVDDGGHLVAFTRMDGVGRVSVRISIDKAFTAAMLQLATDELAPLVQPGASLYGLESTYDGRLICFGGGIPLRSGAHVVGGVGVSGGSVEQDMAVAGAGALALSGSSEEAQGDGK
jgi:uncharacterized protein GlcG (DUF336 family)